MSNVSIRNKIIFSVQTKNNGRNLKYKLLIYDIINNTWLGSLVQFNSLRFESVELE